MQSIKSVQDLYATRLAASRCYAKGDRRAASQYMLKNMEAGRIIAQLLGDAAKQVAAWHVAIGSTPTRPDMQLDFGGAGFRGVQAGILKSLRYQRPLAECLPLLTLEPSAAGDAHEASGLARAPPHSVGRDGPPGVGTPMSQRDQLAVAPP